jgi:hypothetical protein
MTDLKLLAFDSEDLEVISTHVQDAVVRVGDIGYAQADRRFALLMNRFDWETGILANKAQRKRAAIDFGGVRAVASSGFDQNARDGVLELLALSFAETEAPAGIVELTFAGGATIRLTVDVLEARFQDLGAAWATKAKPQHALDGKA